MAHGNILAPGVSAEKPEILEERCSANDAEPSGKNLGRGEHFVVMVQETLAGAEEFRLGRDAANFMEELAIRIDAGGDEVHILLHFLYVRVDAKVFRFHGFVESANVFEQIRRARTEDGKSTNGGANLIEDPGIANGATTDHQSARAGLFEHAKSAFGRIDIAVGKHGEVESFDRAGDQIVMHDRPIHFLNGAAVDREDVRTMLAEDREELVEVCGRIETDARLDGEFDVGNGIAESA